MIELLLCNVFGAQGFAEHTPEALSDGIIDHTVSNDSSPIASSPLSVSPPNYTVSRPVSASGDSSAVVALASQHASGAVPTGSSPAASFPTAITVPRAASPASTPVGAAGGILNILDSVEQGGGAHTTSPTAHTTSPSQPSSPRGNTGAAAGALGSISGILSAVGSVEQAVRGGSSTSAPSSPASPSQPVVIGGVNVSAVSQELDEGIAGIGDVTGETGDAQAAQHAVDDAAALTGVVQQIPFAAIAARLDGSNGTGSGMPAFVKGNASLTAIYNSVGGAKHWDQYTQPQQDLLIQVARILAPEPSLISRIPVVGGALAASIGGESRWDDRLFFRRAPWGTMAEHVRPEIVLTAQQQVALARLAGTLAVTSVRAQRAVTATRTSQAAATPQGGTATRRQSTVGRSGTPPTAVQSQPTHAQ